MTTASKNTRSRLVTWEDPMPSAEIILNTSGLDGLRMMMEGKIPHPPIAETLNYQLEEVDEGRVVFAVTPAEYHYNPIGTVHGGLAATLFDSSLACAIHSTLPVGVGYTTIELHVNYTRAITGKTGRLRCIGEVVHRGRRMATAEARLVDQNGKLYGHATTTCLIFAPSG